MYISQHKFISTLLYIFKLEPTEIVNIVSSTESPNVISPNTNAKSITPSPTTQPPSATAIVMYCIAGAAGLVMAALSATLLYKKVKAKRKQRGKLVFVSESVLLTHRSYVLQMKI